MHKPLSQYQYRSNDVWRNSLDSTFDVSDGCLDAPEVLLNGSVECYEPMSFPEENHTRQTQNYR